jgi:hypothetical protein
MADAFDVNSISTGGCMPNQASPAGNTVVAACGWDRIPTLGVCLIYLQKPELMQVPSQVSRAFHKSAQFEVDS